MSVSWLSATPQASSSVRTVEASSRMVLLYLQIALLWLAKRLGRPAHVSAVSGRLPVRQPLADPPPVAMAPVVRQPLPMSRPSREVRVRDERPPRFETAILQPFL